MRRKWALILGVSSGFGAATARALAREGFGILGVHLDRRSTQPQADAVREDCLALGVPVHFWNENAADDGLIWAQHATEEVGNWEVFLPALVRLYRVITDPEICPYYSFRVEGTGREATYTDL